MKKWIKILITTITIPIVLFVIALVAYILINSQEVIDPLEVGNSHAENRILIASQGSEFKIKLVENILDKFESDKNYFSIVDCTTLENENDEDWDAIIIIHTLQIHEMPEEAKAFLARIKDLSRVMLVSTSGAGDDKVTGFNVDAISSASRTSAIPAIIKWVNKNQNFNNKIVKQ